ncbi:MAG TPA: hypothetical protein VKG89_04540 [Solirubrobacterales bacterium]|nr:hypothetical protein [Solirubrobacterales bacterium]
MRPGLTTPEVRAGGATVAVTAVAVAVLGLLQQVADLFELKPVINTLIVVAVFFGTLALSVLKQRKDREAQLTDALRCWPLPRMNQADPYRLGVFPLLRSLERTRVADYASRGDVDRRLQRALERSSFVLVYGPPRSGKSRTAFAAASEALGDALVVAPRDADGLRELLELDPPLLSRRSRAPRWRRSSKAVLWLDGLERYLDALDANALDAIRAGRIPVTVIATIREDEYDAALEGSGADAEAGKAVASAAQAFHLPAVGLAERLASSGKDERTPVAHRVERPTTEGDPPIRDPHFALPAGLGLVALALIAVIWLASGLKEPVPLSLSEQADQALRAAGTVVLPPAKVDLHGTGQKSWLFAVAPRRTESQIEAGSPPPSNEIRIYDQRGDELKEEFRFQPDEPGAVFQYRGVQELGGAEMLVGGYGFLDQALRALLPFIVYWDADSAEYKMEALQDQPPKLSKPLNPTAAARSYLQAYRKPITLRDRDQGLKLSGYRVQDFAITRDPDRLVSALAVDPRTDTRPGRVEVQGSILSVTPKPDLTPCQFPGARPLVGSWSPDRDLQFEVLDPWKPFIAHHNCVPAQ